MIKGGFAEKRPSSSFWFPRPYRAERVYFGPPRLKPGPSFHGPPGRIRGFPGVPRVPCIPRVPGAIGVDQTLPHAIVPVPLYGSRKVRLGSHGKDCQPLQAQGFYLPVERNLRWAKRLLGLRATRNRVEKEPEGILVAPHGEGTGRCRRHGRFDPDEPPGLGCERTRKYVYRSDG